MTVAVLILLFAIGVLAMPGWLMETIQVLAFGLGVALVVMILFGGAM